MTSAQTSLDDATLTSTIAGTVASVNLTVGQQVTGTSSSSSIGLVVGHRTGSGSSGGGSSFSSGAASTGASSTAASASSSIGVLGSTAQIVVVSTGSYIVNATVDSTEVSQVKVGDQATITVSGVDRPTSTARWPRSACWPPRTSGVSSFPVVIDVTGSPSGLYGGSSATVSIITEELQDVIVVPTTAIHYSGEQHDGHARLRREQGQPGGQDRRRLGTVTPR